MSDSFVRSRADGEDVKSTTGQTAGALGEIEFSVAPYGGLLHQQTGREPTGDGRKSVA